ncbi:unnamed protein product [Chrysoparadoxa australica]
MPVSLKDACLLTGGAIALAVLQMVARQKRSSRPDNEKEHRKGSQSIPAELESELFSRNMCFFKEGFRDIRESFVVVIGLGGVGSHAAAALVRSGVRRIRLVDFDQVSLSSLNRHAVACWADVGLPKAEVMKARLLEIVPNAIIDARVAMYTESQAEEVLEGHPAYVLDCIDDMNSKTSLVVECAMRSIKVISSMGAACKADPTRLHITSLRDAARDPLAAKLKWRLKQFKVVDPEDVLCIYSSELPMMGLLPLSEEQEAKPHDFGAVDFFRIRVLPVLGTVPANFGLAMATWVLCQLGGKPFTPTVSSKVTHKRRHKLVQRLKRREAQVHRTNQAIDLSPADVEYSVNQVWQAKCPISGARMIGQTPLELTKWYADKRLAPDNLVLMSVTAMALMDKKGKGALPPEKVAYVEKVLQQQGSDWTI